MAGNPQGNPQNLKPWTKGQSGNPKGAPRGRRQMRITDALYRILQTKAFAEYVPKTKSEEIAARLVKSALQGDSIASRETIDRTEAKSVARIQMETKVAGKREVQITVQHVQQ